MHYLAQGITLSSSIESTTASLFPCYLCFETLVSSQNLNTTKNRLIFETRDQSSNLETGGASHVFVPNKKGKSMQLNIIEASKVKVNKFLK